MPTVRIPADVDRDDRLLAGLTARQLTILAATGAGALVLGALARQVAPLPVAVVLVWPLVVGGIALALGRRDGMSLDRLALAAWRHHRGPRRLVPAPEGVASPPAWLRPAGATVAVPAPLTLPLRRIARDGFVDLGREGAALVCRASALTFSLRTDAEQAALVAAFGRFLHALTGPVQILVRAIPVDLAGLVAQLERTAGALPDLGLERVACDHARLLADLSARHDVLDREILVVFHEPNGPPAVTAEVLARRAEQAASLLASAGITLVPLAGRGAAEVLAQAMRPEQQAPSGEPAAADQVITATAGGVR